MDIVHSGLRIKIPARKRKLAEVDSDDSCLDSPDIQFPKVCSSVAWFNDAKAEAFF